MDGRAVRRTPAKRARSVRLRLHSLCKRCGGKHRAKRAVCFRCRRYYERHRADYLRRAREGKARALATVAALKRAPCTDCGKRFHFTAMDFDHVGKDKLSNISKLVHNGSLTRARAEMRKCELVCANCHRVRTWRRHEKRVGDGY